MNSLPIPVLKQLETNREEEGVVQFTPDETKILEKLNVHEAIHFDSIFNETGFSQGHLSKLLFDLEIIGVVKQVPGRLYFRVL